MKIKSLLYTALASILLFASCDLNKQPEFDDNTQAHVAFTATSGNVKEAVDGVPGVIELKLVAASKAGVATAVTFATTDTAYAEKLRAVEGVNYRIVKIETYQELNNGRTRENVISTEFTAETPRVINFDADHRFASIYIETIDNDEESGDAKFDVVLTNSTNTLLGAHKSFAITISDDENPMNTLVGTYKAHAVSMFTGYPDEEWELTITRDDEDETKLWIHPICNFGGLPASSIAPAECVVDLVAGTIQVPYSQTLYGADGQTYHMILAGLTSSGEPILTGAAVANFTIADNDVTIEFTAGYGVGNVAANEWWYQAIEAPTYVKL